MKKLFNTIPGILTLIIIVLSAIASAAGTFFGIYRDNEMIKAVWSGNDIVTLFFVIPLMVILLYQTARNSVRARLVWMGTLWYMVYNYIFYTYAAAFNKFFLAYVIIFTLSVYALIIALMQTDKENLARKISPDIPVRRISGFMIFFSIFLGGLWLSQIAGFIITGEVPRSITQTGHPTSVVFATDLSLLVSSLLTGAILLWKKHLWGYIVAVIAMTKCLLYPFVLVVGSIVSYYRTGIWDDLVPVYSILWVGCAVSFFFLIRGIKEPS